MRCLLLLVCDTKMSKQLLKELLFVSMINKNLNEELD